MIFLFLIMTIQQTTTQLQVDKIDSNSGFTIIREGQISIPQTYNYSLHIFDLKQINELITELELSTTLFPNPISQNLMNEVSKLKDKLNTLRNGHHISRKRRGLFNFI